MKNITDLRNELINVFDQVKKDSIDLDKAKELNRTAGKIISTLNVQLKANELCEKKPNIRFLNTGK